MRGEIGWSIDEVFERAIRREEEAQLLYCWASERASLPGSKKLLMELAEEEGKHEEKLLKARRGDSTLQRWKREKVEDLRIIDYLEEAKLSDDSRFNEILIFAGKKEKESYEYYKSLGDRLRGTEVERLFKDLAEEELSHKHKIEKIYDSEVLRET